MRDAELLARALDVALGEHGDSALPDYDRAREAAARPVFDITTRMSAYPPAAEFVALQMQLAKAIEAEALELAAKEVPQRCELAVA